MTAAGGVYLAACALLVAAGMAKVRRPGGAQAAMAALFGPRLSVPRTAVRLGGTLEVALGTAALITTSAGPAAAVGACYAAFALFVAASLARGATAGCGCFGQAMGQVPPGRLHLVANVVLAAAALVVTSAGGVDGPATERAVVAVAAAGLAWVIYLVLVPLPLLAAAVREPGR